MSKEINTEHDGTMVIVSYDHYLKAWTMEGVQNYVDTIVTPETSSNGTEYNQRHYWHQMKKFNPSKPCTKERMIDSAIDHAKKYGIKKVEVRNKDYGRVNGSWKSRMINLED